MQIRRRNIFTTIRTEGAILPPDLLQRVASGSRELAGLTPEDYHLGKGERLNEVINRSWNRLLGVWAGFRTGLVKLPERDKGTSLTRERWLLVLFQELGYGRLPGTRAIEIADKTYPISHTWQHTPIHLVGCRVNLDRRTPGVSGAARMSPHSLVQEFLNRSNDHLWGFLSNGLTLRILRDNLSLTRDAYVEFDMQAMMDGEIYADFALLWLLCHQSRVEAQRPEQCWLEKWSHEAQEQGTRVLDQLRKGVEEAITALGQGFLIHPPNRGLRDRLQSGDLATQDYYRQLLRLVYRLLFLFVAEDRGLLLNPAAPAQAKERYTNFYSTARLRRLAGRRRGTRHADLYMGLRLVMEKLGSAEGCPQLGLPALGSFLWSEKSICDLAQFDLTNRDMLDAVRALSFTVDNQARRLVDFKNLGAEELGSVYESLLELHPVLDPGSGTFELKAASGSERKTTGSYYTPTSLINCLLDSALEPVLDEAVKQKDPVSAILNLKICDPASGSGHFLIAAAHRVAKRLAAVRTGEEEPAPEERRTALRDVIGRCVYGVDVNEMAVELCKVSLWMEALEPGKPLSFLDHRIQCGNSLLGATPALLKQGIPDNAFKPIEGDNKEICKDYKKRNREERESGQGTFFDYAGEAWPLLEELGICLTGIDSIDDNSLAGIRRKEERYQECVNSPGYLNSRTVADAWCAAFVWKKTSEFPYPITQGILKKIEKNPGGIKYWMKEETQRLAEQYQFFHWHLAFPEVFRVPGEGEIPNNEQAGWSGGFDVVLGNPPWERVKLQEKEWFAVRRPDIANAPNAAARRRMISALAVEDPALHKAFLDDRRKAEGESQFIRNSARYPLCGRGDVNTYAVFAEIMSVLINSTGRLGCIVPSGIATDDTTKLFFQYLLNNKILVSIYDFENRKGIFRGVQGNVRFCLLTISGRKENKVILVAAQLNDPSQITDGLNAYQLTNEDIERINPNTLNCPTFGTSKDADIVKAIYTNMPVLINEKNKDGNPWSIKFLTMLHMTNNSHLFLTYEQLNSRGWLLYGNVFVKNDKQYLPLYESKLTNQYNHRAATFDGVPEPERFKIHARTNILSSDHLCSANHYPIPRYWVSKEDIISITGLERQWFVGFRNAISAVADSRSLVATHA